jgi:3-oxoadipate enol-lactonase
MPTEAYLSQLSAIRTHDATGRLGGVSVPTLVLAGEDDILIPVPLSRRLREAVPGSEWAATKGGHACLWEHPEPFNGAILRFLERQRA